MIEVQKLGRKKVKSKQDMKDAVENDEEVEVQL